MANNSQVNIGIKFKTDSKEIEQSLNKLKKSLQDIQKIKPGNFSGTKKQLEDIKETASKVEQAMEKAFNPTLNTTNIATFKSSLKDSGLTVNQVKSDFSKLGVQGEVAFNRMTSSLLTTNLQLKQTSKFLSDMGDTMVKTVKWGIASSIMNSFSSSVQGAFSYVQSLEKSLTNIRIVTGDSTQKMAQFADQANRSAQALGRSTLDYTKASLTFYQQGLNDQDVQARTEATLKAQNITGAGQEMADYLTSVWNGYKVANEQAELYVDKLAAVADSSASDMSELAIAMSKVASTAHTMGVDVDQLNGMIATVVATTRQAPEAVGTAFKTIFSRMNDIQAGAEDAEISLGNYSGKMAQLGFNVLDATGHLRDTGQVMEEIGGRWQDLTKEQQIYLAQTMGGQRQVNQLMALFDNWTTYSELLNTSLEAEGTLAQKNSIYMESLGAKMEQLGAAGERVKDALINSDSFKTMIEGLTGVTNLVGNLFETMGNGNVVLFAFGTTLTQLFSGTIAKEISNVITNMNNAKANAETLRNQLEMTEAVQKVGQETAGGNLVTDKMAEMQRYYSVMNQGSINAQKNLIAERGQLQNQIKILEADRKAAQELQEALSNTKIKKEDWEDAKNNFIDLNAALDGVKQSLSQVNKLKAKDLFENIFDPNQAGAQENFTKVFEKFVDNYENIDPSKAKELRELFGDFTSGQISGEAFWRNLNEGLDNADATARKLTNTLENNNQQLENSVNKAKQLDGVLKSANQHNKQLFDITNVVKMVSAIGQISSTLITIKNLKSIWDDKDVSTGEKIAKTVSSIAFIFPTLVTSVKALRTSTAAIIKEQAIRVAHQKMVSLELERQNAALAYQKGLITLDKYKQSYDAVMKAKAEYDEFSSKAAKGLPLLSNGLTGILGTLGSMLPILLAIGVAVGAIYLAYKEWNKQADAAKKAEQAAADAKKAYDDLKTSLQDVKSAIEDLRKSEDNLDNLVAGTQEWRDALQECNDKVLDLITKYPELAQYVDNVNGKLTLSEEGEKEYLTQQQAKIQAAQNASYTAASNARQASAMASAAQIGHNSLYQQTSKRRSYTYAGAKVSDATTSKYSSAEDVMKVVTSLDELIDKGTTKISDDFTQLADIISEETGISKDQVSAILSNKEALIQLRGQLQQNEEADKLMYETMAQNTLMDNSTYKGLDEIGKQVANAIGGADLQKATDEAYKTWINRMSGLKMDRFDLASDSNVQDILEAFNKAQGGTHWRMDSNAVRGGEGNRTLAFVEEDGKTLHEFTREQIASTIAAHEALQKLSGSAETASSILSGIDKNTTENNNEAVKQWVANQNMSAINTAGLESLDRDITKVLGTEGAKALAETRGLSMDALQAEWNQALDDLGNKFKTVAKEASESVQQAFGNIKNNPGIKNATLDFQQMVVEDMQKAFLTGGKKSLDQISKLYGEQIQDFEKFDSVIKDFDFSKGVGALKTALEEAGAATDVSTQALQAYIKIQQQAAESMSPEGTYSTIHGITDKVKKRGDKIDANQAATLEEAGINVNAFFTKLLDGSYKLITSVDAFQQHVNNVTVQPFKAKMGELQAQINSIHAFEDGAYSSNNMSIEEFSSVAGNIVDSRGKKTQTVTEQDTEKLRAQVEFLRIVGEQDRAISQAEAAINEKRILGAEYLQKISDLIKEHSKDYGNLSETEKQLLQEMSAVQEAVANTLKPPLDQDVKEEAWENLTQHLEDYADQIEGVSAQLKDNAQVAGDVAEAILRYDSALGKVKKNFDGWLESLSSDSIADHAQIAEELQNVYSDLLDLPFDNILSDNFLQDVDNLNLLKQAANGSEQAYDELLQKAQQDIQGKVSLDNTQFWNAKDEVTNAMDEMNFQDIQIGADLDTGNFISQLQNMVNAAGMSAEQATDYLASMGIDAEVEEIDSSDTETKQSTGYTANLIPHTQYGTFPAYPEGAVAPTQVDTTYTTYSQEVSPQKQVSEDLKENKAFTLKVKSAHKSSGGGFKYRNASAGNKGGSGKKGNKGGKGGGGNKGKQGTTAKPATDKADRYRNNTVKMNKLTNQLVKLQKQSNELEGKDKIKNLEKQRAILQEQNKTIKERINLQRNQQKQLANNLKNFGATFDPDGTLNNYFDVHAKILDEYNKKVAEWNSHANKDDGWQEAHKDYLNDAKTIMDQALKDLAQYDKLQQEIADKQQEQLDNLQKQIDLKVQRLELKIEATLDLAKLKRDWNSFKRDIIEDIRDDDILGLNNYRFADINSYFNSNQTGSIQQLANKLATITKSSNGTFTAEGIAEDLSKLSKTDREARLKEIESISSSLFSEMTDFKELVDDIKNSIFDAIDAAQEAFDQQMDEYEFLGDTLEHNKKLIQLMYGDKAYAAMDKYYSEIQKNNNNQLDFLVQEKDLWYSRMEEDKARMEQFAKTEGVDSNNYKDAQKRFKEQEKHWMDSVKNLNATLEDAIQNIIDKYNNALNQIFLDFEKSIGNGHTLDEIGDEWDMLNEKADMYFDKINSAYELDKLGNAFEDAIKENEGNIAAQQSLNDLMEQQLGYLRDKDKLTQYDVDRANTLLQIEIKRLALQQSRSNKNRLRLRRDSQGNYTYQYTADTESINKAEQELADARNSLYNSDKAAYVDNLNSLQKSADNIKQKLYDIWTDTSLTDEQRQQKSYELYKYYGEQINDLMADNATIRNNLMESSFAELAKMAGISQDELRAMSKQQQDQLFKDLIPQANSWAAGLVDSITGEGGFLSIFEEWMNSLRDAKEQEKKEMSDTMDIAHKNVDDIVSDTDVLAQQIRKLLEPNKALVEKHKEEIEQVQEYINYLGQVLNIYEKIQEQASKAMSAAYAVLKADAAGLLNSSFNKQNKTVSKENKARTDYFKNNNSGSDLGPDYVPYEPNWQSTNFAAMFGSSNVDEISMLHQQNADKIKNNSTLTEEQKQKALEQNDTVVYSYIKDINLSKVLSSLDEGVLSINAQLNAIYLANEAFFKSSLEKQDDIQKAITNQTIQISADFPNAKDVQSIIQAIESLPEKAAQYAGKI